MYVTRITITNCLEYNIFTSVYLQGFRLNNRRALLCNDNNIIIHYCLYYFFAPSRALLNRRHFLKQTTFRYLFTIIPADTSLVTNLVRVNSANNNAHILQQHFIFFRRAAFYRLSRLEL
jgi:hypothetical protein